MKRTGRLGVGFSLIFIGLAWMIINARLGIGVRSIGQPTAVAGGTSYAATAPTTGFLTAGGLRVAVDWPRDALSRLPMAPAGQIYRVAHVQIQLDGSFRHPVTADPVWFTLRDGRGLIVGPNTYVGGIRGLLHRQVLTTGQTAGGLLTFRVPSGHGPLGLVVAVPWAPGGALIWRVPERK